MRSPSSGLTRAPWPRVAFALTGSGVWLALVASACGSRTDLDLGPLSTAAQDGGLDTTFACVLEPVEGAPCSASDGLCSPGDPCIEPTWICQGGTWDLLATQDCIDGGGIDDAGSGDDVIEDDSGFTDDTGFEDGGADDTSDDSGSEDGGCGFCKGGTVCVATSSSGGPCLMPNDAGVCPGGGMAPPGECCDTSSTSFSCEPIPTDCFDGVTCACAASLCPDGCQCVVGATSGGLVCECDLP